jgi:hypothetical protein
MLIFEIRACASTMCCVRIWAVLLVCFCLECFDNYSRYIMSSICIFSSFSVKVNKFMLVVLYCYMRKFRACEPPEQHLLCTLSADMCPCTESWIFCGLCPYCAQTNCRRTVSVLWRLILKTSCKVCRSARVRVRSAYTLISFHIAHHILFPHLFGLSSQWSHVTEGRCSLNVCGVHIFKEKKE